MPEQKRTFRRSLKIPEKDDTLVKLLYDVGEGLSDFTEKCEFDLTKCLEVGSIGALEDFYRRRFGSTPRIAVSLVTPWLRLVKQLNVTSEQEFHKALKQKHGIQNVREYHADLLDDQADWDTFVIRSGVALKSILHSYQPTYINTDEIVALFDMESNSTIKGIPTSGKEFTFLTVAGSVAAFSAVESQQIFLPKNLRASVSSFLVVGGKREEVQLWRSTLPRGISVFVDETKSLLSEIFKPTNLLKQFSSRNIRESIFRAMEELGATKVYSNPAACVSYLNKSQDFSSNTARILLRKDGNVEFFSNNSPDSETQELYTTTKHFISYLSSSPDFEVTRL